MVNLFPKPLSKPSVLRDAYADYDWIGATSAARARPYNHGRTRFFRRHETPFTVENAGAFGVFRGELEKSMRGIVSPMTARDAARLQSFPEDFTWQCSEVEAWAQIGNAVSPQLMKAVAENLRKHSSLNSKPSPTVISLFAGCGGSSLGYKLAGFRELLAVECDDNAVETFKLNFPGVPVYHGDICKLSGAECLRLAGIKRGQLDVLDGSPPCQGFSTAGKRRFNDPRNSLFKEFARLLKELQPRVFVMENVTGMVKGVMKQAYLTIIAELRACGYRAKGEVLNAMYFNVPQSRERVIIIGVRNDLEAEPGHPKPMTLQTPIRSICPDAKGTRSQKINPWVKASRAAVTISKTSRDWAILTTKGERKPTMSELKRLGSFPESFKFQGDSAQAWQRIGNSVPPNLMRAIAEHVRKEILKA